MTDERDTHAVEVYISSSIAGVVETKIFPSYPDGSQAKRCLYGGFTGSRIENSTGGSAPQRISHSMVPPIQPTTLAYSLMLPDHRPTS